MNEKQSPMATNPYQVRAASRQQEARSARKTFSRIGLAMFLFLLVQQVVVGILYAVIVVTAPQWMATGWFNWVLSYVPLYFVAFPVFLLVIRKMPQQDKPSSNLRQVTPFAFIRLVVASVAIFYIFNLITVLISTLIASINGTGIANPAAETITNSNPWVNLFFTCLVAPVMEEIIFRQLLYKRLIAYGGKTFILFSALMFAMLHPNLYQLVYAFVLGVLFGALRYFTGKLWPCIALHLAVNLIGSGFSMIMLQYFGEQFMEIWAFVLIGLTVLGIIVIAHWFFKHRKGFVLERGSLPAPSAGTAILNVGVILYTLVVVFLIVSTIVM